MEAVIVDESKYIRINCTPMTSPRPRLGRNKTFMPVVYKHYLENLIDEMYRSKIEKGDYSKLEVIAYFPYPATTPKKRLIEGFPMRKKPDYDNTAKGITDALVKAGLIDDDNQIYRAIVMKLYTTEKKGRILLKLI